MLERPTKDTNLFRRTLLGSAIFALLLVGLAGAGCTTAWVQEQRVAPTGLASQDVVGVMLAAPVKDDYLTELEDQVTGCVQSYLKGTHPDLRIIPPSEFRKLAFPDLTADQLPSGYFAWQRLLRDPAFYVKIAPLGLRYVLAVGTEQGHRLTEVEWSAATSMLGGPGPSLSASWDNEVLLEAIVVDARHRRVAGAVQAYAKGKSGAGVSLVTLPVPLLLPHGITSFPFGVACRGLGEGLAKFLVEGGPGEETAAR